MKVAVIGSGKTGSAVIALAQSRDYQFEVFNRSNPPTANNLKPFDVAICFIPAVAFQNIAPALIESGIHAIVASTGEGMEQMLKGLKSKMKKQVWVWGTNFSLGMRIVHRMISQLSGAPFLMPEGSFRLHEVHHTKKLDGPSGTALSWRQWLDLGDQVPITFDRRGDVVGDHELIFETRLERIEIRHHAKSRALFAQGAFWCAEQILKHKTKSGLYYFEQFADKRLKDLT